MRVPDNAIRKVVALATLESGEIFSTLRTRPAQMSRNSCGNWVGEQLVLELCQLIVPISQDCARATDGAREPSHGAGERQPPGLCERAYEHVALCALRILHNHPLIQACLRFCPSAPSKQMGLVRRGARAADILLVAVATTVAGMQHRPLDGAQGDMAAAAVLWE
jgi:hypothetical protein